MYSGPWIRPISLSPGLQSAQIGWIFVLWPVLFEITGIQHMDKQTLPQRQLFLLHWTLHFLFQLKNHHFPETSILILDCTDIEFNKHKKDKVVWITLLFCNKLFTRDWSVIITFNKSDKYLFSSLVFMVWSTNTDLVLRVYQNPSRSVW